MKSYRVYLIINEAGRRYIAISENVTKRLADHNAGRSKWTAKYRQPDFFRLLQGEA